MCGIVGAVGPLNQKGKRIFEDMRTVVAVRGINGCGVAFVNEQQHVHLIKGDVLPQELRDSKRYHKAMARKNIAFIAHSRAATIGGVTDDMCHPFKFKNCTGVHNGTIMAHGRKHLYSPDKFESDSENIFATIDKWGIRKTWKNLDGSACLVWWDKREKALCIIRNDKRPMYFVFLDVTGEAHHGPAMIFASEAWMLTSICRRHNVPHSQVWIPTENRLYKFKYDAKKKMVHYDVEDVEKYTYTYPNPTYPPLANVSCIRGGHGRASGATTKIPWRDGHPVTGEYPDNEDWDDSGYLGHWSMMGTFISSELSEKDMTILQFRQEYEVCVNCNKKLWHEYDTATIIDSNMAVCGSCTKAHIEAPHKSEKRMH